MAYANPKRLVLHCDPSRSANNRTSIVMGPDECHRPLLSFRCDGRNETINSVADMNFIVKSI
jgi:hypothetical protein